ncbi:MAG: selenide, water dikinase SelD, partial [Longimicrobiales bacterium]
LPGDRLVLTKPLGTGIIATAIKRGMAPGEAVERAVASMTTLNRGAADAARAIGVSAATDVTGFGLLGHLRVVVRESGVAARLSASSVPALPHALALASNGAVAGGTRRNLEDVGPDVAWATGIDEPLRVLLADAQTSGGLLLAVPAAKTDPLVRALEAAGTPAAAVIGEIVAGEPGRMEVAR